MDQAGLRDGAEIIREFLANGEAGLALEHLCYMVEETGLPISAETHASLMAAAQELQRDTCEPGGRPWNPKTSSSRRRV